KLAEAVQKRQPLYLGREKKLFLPLVLDDELLGVFMARGVTLSSPKKVLPLLFHLSCLTLEKLCFYKQSICDPLTGLSSRTALLEQVTSEIDLITSCILPGADASLECSLPNYSATFGILLVDLDMFKWVNRSFGYGFGDQVLNRIADELKEVCPDQVLLARLEKDRFGLFWPQASPKRCARLAEKVRERIGKMVHEIVLTQEQITLTASVGVANFPHDMQGWQLKTPSMEQARIILEKAEKGLAAAKSGGGNAVCSFRDILAQGGSVVEVLPMNRLIVNLGRSVDASEGTRFLIWSSKFNGTAKIREKGGGLYPPMHKGEIQLMEVQEEIAVAEVLYLDDPSWRVEPGDRLTLVSGDERIFEEDRLPHRSEQTRKDPLTGLYPFRDFLREWHTARAGQERFAMLMCRMQDDSRSRRSGQRSLSESTVGKIATAFQKILVAPLGGRYSSNTLIFFWKLEDEPREMLISKVAELLTTVEQRYNLTLACGIAVYPWLQFARSDTLENCRKALAHAMLLQRPQVAMLNSVTLNISADSAFTQGDLYSAMEEYKLALLDDPENHVARNSLGICFARLGHFREARTQFARILEHEPDNFMAHYNLACVCLKTRDREEARREFERCLTLRPGHTFTLIRLGDMAEQDGNLREAWSCYCKALEDPEAGRLAHRYLARVALKEGRDEDAREHLHKALLFNPKDAHSLHLLARNYLDKGEDPQIAESLARQSASLRPGCSAYWVELVRALELQGRTEEADSIRIRIRGREDLKSARGERPVASGDEDLGSVKREA
ncbi:MAG: diguanylate cyclase domain-containing protein, partial [Desulfovibrionales bacterium]